MTPEQAGQALVTMQSAWPGFAGDDIAVGLWLTRLKAMPLEVARDAVSRLVDTRAKAPAIADWHDAVKAVTEGGAERVEQWWCSECYTADGVLVARHGHAVVTAEPTPEGYAAIAAAKELAQRFSGKQRQRRVERTADL